MIGEKSMTYFDHSKINLYNNIEQSKAFTCPNCGGFASHEWRAISVFFNPFREIETPFIIIAKCQACQEYSIWLTDNKTIHENKAISVLENSEKLLYPIKILGVPSPNQDMPDDVKEIYIEASEILDKSPRSSAALSRLAIEKLVDHLKAEGKDLNNKIGYLVRQGMPIEIQQMLDSVRVVGNNAVHPGQIDLKDNKELAASLLTFVNLIVDNRISQPKKIKSVYDSLPESYRKAIDRRDN